MTTPAPVDLAGLRALAQDANPGPWETEDSDRVVIQPDGTYIAGDPETYLDECDARFIAAANPAVVLALIARLEAAERALSDLRGFHDYYNNDSLVMEPEEESLWYKANDALAAYDRLAQSGASRDQAGGGE